jgi:putative membrane protein
MNAMRILAGLLVLTGWLCLSNVAPADDAKKVGGDKHFMMKASAAGLAEVNLSELALRRASSPAVREFARRIVNDHTQANRQLLNIANRQQILGAEKMDDTHTKLRDKLAKLEGAEFDREYMEAMVKDHEEAVKLFEKQSKEGQDAALKAAAGDLLPTLKKHLESAREICKEVKGKGETKR